MTMLEGIIIELNKGMPWCKIWEYERQRRKTKPVLLELQRRAGTVQRSRGRTLAGQPPWQERHGENWGSTAHISASLFDISEAIILVFTSLSFEIVNFDMATNRSQYKYPTVNLILIQQTTVPGFDYMSFCICTCPEFPSPILDGRSLSVRTLEQRH